MAGILSIDLGTTAIKVAHRIGGEMHSWRHGRTPRTPRQVLEAVDSILASNDASFLIISSFRRAVVINEDSMVLARESGRTCVVQLAGAPEGCCLNDALATIHRWALAKSARPATLDSWLAERLTGANVLSESMAWLTGAWDTDTGMWVPEILTAAGLSVDALPEVVTAPTVRGSMILPILGDHEATLVLAAQALDDVCVLECGSAMAFLTELPGFDRHGVGVFSPRRARYAEFIDPHLIRRLDKGSAPLPDWLPNKGEPADLTGLLRGTLELIDESRTITVCGGNALPVAATISMLAPSRSVVVDSSLCPARGALQLAERYAGY